MNYKKESYLWFCIDLAIYFFVIVFLGQLYINQVGISNIEIFQFVSKSLETNNVLMILFLLGIFTKGIYFIVTKILLKLLKIKIESLKLSFAISASIILTLLIVVVLLDFNLIHEGFIVNILMCLLSPIIMINALKEDFKNRNVAKL